MFPYFRYPCEKFFFCPLMYESLRSIQFCCKSLFTSRFSINIFPLLIQTTKAEQKKHASRRQYLKFSTNMTKFSFHKIKPVSPHLLMKKETTQYSSNFYSSNLSKQKSRLSILISSTGIININYLLIHEHHSRQDITFSHSALAVDFSMFMLFRQTSSTAHSAANPFRSTPDTALD